jgi:molybdopterin synthase sulfur carrier subunit
MPTVVFTSNLQRHLDAPPSAVDATTVRQALDAVFADNPQLRSYILDDQDRVRQHVVLFVDGQRADLNDAIAPQAELYVLQALSGG